MLDQMNRQVEIPQNPRRIISLVPSQTELLFDLGLAERVVGITKFCVHPREKFKITPKIGGTKQFKFEVIDALQPDLIIGNKEENYQAGIETLAQKYPVWMSDIISFEDALQMIAQVGELVNESEKSQSIVNQIVTKFDSLNLLRAMSNKPLKVAYFIWFEPLLVAGSSTFIHTMLEKIGLVNAFAHLSRYPEITPEILQESQPDLIFLSSEPFPFKTKHLNIMQAICPKAQVKLVDGEMFSWYGTRLLKAADYFENLWQNINISDNSYK
jgi:ABC-type Fe3+-hydroxamate transport system substrate-binding protein